MEVRRRFAQQYIAAGIWVVLILWTAVTVSALCCHGVQAVAALREAGAPKRAVRGKVLGYFFAIGTIVAFAWVTLWMLGVRLSFPGVISLTAAALSVFLHQEMLVPESRLKKWDEFLTRQVQLGPELPSTADLLRYLATGALLLLAVLLFGLDIYRTIPSHWGGGRPVLASVVIDTSHQAAIRELEAETRVPGPTQVTGGAVVQPPVWVLLMTDDALLVRTDPPPCPAKPGCRPARAIVIRREIVDAIAFVGR